MSVTRVKITVSAALALIIGLVIIQGCGEITGDFSANQPPVVEIVNVPPDAWGTMVTKHQGMPFTVDAFDVPLTILDIEGAMMEPDSAIKVYQMVLDTTLLPEDTVYIEVVFEEDNDYTMDRNAGTLTALASGIMVLDDIYLIDFCFSYENYYVFSYAPTIYWSGYDPDGFIDHYSYADVTDSAFIAAFRDSLNPDPIAYAQQNITSAMWVDTSAMSARIYLLTTEGDTTEHLFFVRAVDNLETESNVDVKTFYRSNNAPYNPNIKPLESPDAEYTQHYIVEDTLFCLDEISPPWMGIGFNWTADDPDEKELIQIPLEYTYYLVKTPGDTIWNNGASDSIWSETNQVELYGLETGAYTLSVWVRDDGYTLCAEPATVTFTAVKPTLEHHILVVDETEVAFPIGFELPIGMRDDPINFYLDILQNLEGQLERDNYVMDGVDVRVLDNKNTTAIGMSPIPYSIIGLYKLVIILDDDHSNVSTAEGGYAANRNQVLADYMDIGGRVWIEGRKMLIGSYGYSAGPNDIASAGTAPSILSDYFLLEDGFGASAENTFIIPFFPPPSQFNEFIGATSSLTGFPNLEIDTTKSHLLAQAPGQPPTTLVDVDWFTRSEQATAIYTYQSITADPAQTSPYIVDEDTEVAFGATPVQCTIIPENPGLMDVTRVWKITATDTIEGEVSNFNATEITVSYPYGQPWSSDDTLEVDYMYDPVSEYHLKPVAARYEDRPRTLVTTEINGVTISYYIYDLGYRSAFFSFPMFYMKNDEDQVQEVFRQMLNWFFYPTIHWNIN
jgi:hypothetical protein